MHGNAVDAQLCERKLTVIISKMGKAKKHPSRPVKHADDVSAWRMSPETAAPSTGVIDRHELYQKAVQSPAGDISYMVKFFRQYVGLQVPLHLREDFSGTSLICATWCKSDVRRTALGVDIDREALQWGWRHNGQAMLGQAESQMCLLEANVLENLSTYPNVGRAIADENSQEPTDQAQVDQHVSRPADIICALNFSVFLLDSRQDVVKYFQLARAAMNSEDGSIFLLDMLGGHAGESSMKLRRQNEITGLSYLWEQAKYDPVKRQLTCHISLKNPHTSQVMKHAFTYHWKLWTIPEVLEMLQEAGFAEVHVWMRCMLVSQASSIKCPVHVTCLLLQPVSVQPQLDTAESPETDGQDDVENDFEDYEAFASDPAMLSRLSKGWTAYLVAVVQANTL